MNKSNRHYIQAALIIISILAFMYGCSGDSKSGDDKSGLQPPVNINVQNSDGSVTLTWSSDEDTSYIIYRSDIKEFDAGESNQVTTTETGDSEYTDRGLENGRSYFYKIAAFKDGELSFASDAIEARPNNISVTLDIPQGLGAEAGDQYVLLSWQAKENTSYEIHRSGNSRLEPSANTLLFRTQPGEAEYTDESVSNNVPYYYLVIAVQDQLKSEPSQPVEATPAASTSPPATPSGLASVSGDSFVILSWQGMANLIYKIYRSKTQNFSISEDTLIATTELGATEYSDATAINSEVYYYRIVAINNLLESDPTSSIKGEPNTKPETPEVIGIAEDDGRITLNWVGAGEYTYEIHRSRASMFTPSNETRQAVTEIGAAQYVDTSVENDQTYYYVLIAYHGVVASDASDPVSGTPSAVPTPTPSIEIVPGLRSITINMSSDSVVDEYVVYYNEQGNVTKNDHEIYRGANTTFVHRALSNMNIYYYRVAAITANKESDLSLEKSSFPFVHNRAEQKVYPQLPNEWLFDVAYTGQQYVAVGDADTIITSPDLVDWTMQNVPNGSTRNKQIAYSSNGIVVVASRRGLLRSDDYGATWNKVPAISNLNENRSITSVFHDGSKFVAFAGGIYLESSDGLEWFRANTQGVRFGTDEMIRANNQYIAIDTSTVSVSMDGVYWDLTYTAQADEFLYGLGFTNGYYFINKKFGGNSAFSNNLSEWTAIGLFTSTYFDNTFYVNELNRYFNLEDSRIVHRSGDTNTELSTGWRRSFRDVRPPIQIGKWITNNPDKPGHIVAAGSTGAIASSTNGLSWTLHTMNDTLNDAYWDGAKLIGVGTKFVLTTTDTQSWQMYSTDYELISIIHDGSQYIATGILVSNPDYNTSTRRAGIFTSLDGIEWRTEHLFDEYFYLSALASNGDHVVAAGSGKIVTNASDGAWKVVTPDQPLQSNVRKVLWNGEAFVMLSISGLYGSQDGVTWERTFDFTSPGGGLTLKDNVFYSSTVNQLLISTNGFDWRAVTFDISVPLPDQFYSNRLHWDGNQFWAWYSGSSYISPNGIHWNKLGINRSGKIVDMGSKKFVLPGYTID